VLLVEDEDVVRNLPRARWRRQGYEVLEAGTGVEALEVMEREKGKVDIVVSDVIMPEMDGPTLLKELRKTNPGLKFIFVSGYPDDAFKKTLDENEAYAFLAKPFTLPQLAAKVKEQLGGLTVRPSCPALSLIRVVHLARHNRGTIAEQERNVYIVVKGRVAFGSMCNS
jgi:two-component system cell cycle sensor histidine kinase/response regulator CckA